MVIEHVKVCESELSLSDVAIGPEGSTVLATVQKGGYLAQLELKDGTLTSTGRKFSVYGQPYRVVISPDGRFGITAGAGSGDPIDPDALTIIDLQANPPSVTDHITIDPVTESLEISPDGRLIAAVCMSGSNLSAQDPNRTEFGRMVILKRSREGYKVSQRLPTGRIQRALHSPRTENIWQFNAIQPEKSGFIKSEEQKSVTLGTESKPRGSPLHYVPQVLDQKDKSTA